jgi:serine/threonine protein kinase
VIFCHKHDTVNINLNIDNLGFDTQLRPILLDFSRAIVLSHDQKTSRFSSVMSSTPPELALLMGSENPLMNIELNGCVLRKADAWRVGVLLYVLITGRLPFHSTSLGNFITHVLTRPPVIPIDQIKCSQALKNLLHRLLETTYFNRLEIGDALRDAWFRNASKKQISSEVIGNIRNVCKLENARNWISTITHGDGSGSKNITESERADTKKLDRDRKYFARLDPTGQRKSCKREMLEQFMQDRLGYCNYRAKQIIQVFIAQMQSIADSEESLNQNVYNSNITNESNNIYGHVRQVSDRAYTWKEFLPLYETRCWKHSHSTIMNNSKNNSNSNNYGRHSTNIYVSEDADSATRRFTNAIFAGLDPEGRGRVSCKLLMALFEDINLKLAHIVDRLSFQPQMSFEECVAELTQAFQSGFDIKDLLSVDHIVNSM